MPIDKKPTEIRRLIGSLTKWDVSDGIKKRLKENLEKLSDAELKEAIAFHKKYVAAIKDSHILPILRSSNPKLQDISGGIQ